MEGNSKVSIVNSMEDQSHLTGLYTKHALQFIKSNKKKPFFLYMPHSMPHVPIAASEKFKGKSGAGVYGDVMMELDWSVGEILKTIKEQGLEDNTLIILTSDNGPWRKFGNWGGSSGGLREGKTTVFEGGQRVPCVMKWNGNIPEGVVNNKLASSIDLLPTLVAICGLQMPVNKIDGVDITDLLKGIAKPSPRSNFYYYFDDNSLKAVRRDDWKLMLPHDFFTYEKDLLGKDGVPGKTTKVNFPMALYDLRQDPGERYDLQESYPEIVVELQKLADKAREDLGDDLKGIIGKNRRPAGTLNN
jgi:arylsulfatase